MGLGSGVTLLGGSGGLVSGQYVDFSDTLKGVLIGVMILISL